MAEKTTNEESTSSNENSKSRWTIGRIVTIATGFILLLFVLLFLLTLALALNDPFYWGGVIQTLRDYIIIAIIFQGILIIGAIAVLIVQIARFVNLLQNEVKPILENTQDTLKTARQTTEFVGKNAAEPIIKSKTFIAGLTTFLREILAIRRLIRRKETPQTETPEPQEMKS